MGGWVPGIPPQVLAAALARRGGVPPAPAPVPPLPSTGAVPLATRPPVTLPQAQASGPLPMARPAPAAPLIRMGPGGVNLDPGPPGVGANGIPSVPSNYTPPSAAPPKPSDDPAISPEMRKAMQPVQDAQAALDAEEKKYEGLSNQAAALKPPNYADYKPPLWKRIAAPFVGALAGRNAEPAVNAMLNGPYARAEHSYEQQKSALQEQLEAERGIGIPLAESRARVAQEGFSNQMAVKREAREQQAADSNEEFKSKLNEIRQAYDEGRIQDAKQRLDEQAEKNKADADRTNQILELRSKMVGIEQQNADTKAAAEAGGNGMSASEQREFNAKTRRYNGEIEALERERAQMIGIDGDFAKKRLAAIDARLDELHGNIDKAEQDIISRRPATRSGAAPGGPAAAPKTFKAPAGAPAPTKEGQILKNHGQVAALAVKDASGKLTWGPPQ